MMPDMDGIETTMHIRALGDDENSRMYYRSVPIIALTANAVSGTKEMFLENRFDDFLTKPIDTVKLNSILGKWIPKEKQKASTREAAKADAPQIPNTETRFEIEGLDVKQGILLSGGTMEIFLEALGLFCKDGLEKIKEIGTCLETGNLHLYTIYIHGLKSASAIIGASKISEEARILEMAGENEDLNFINAHNADFLSDLKSLLDNISAIPALSGNNAGKKEPIDTETLRLELVKLKTALASFDVAVISKIIENLEKTAREKGIASAVGSISEKILVAEYDEAITLIDELLREKK